jgi:hypothetical protein
MTPVLQHSLSYSVLDSQSAGVGLITIKGCEILYTVKKGESMLSCVPSADLSPLPVELANFPFICFA